MHLSRRISLRLGAATASGIAVLCVIGVAPALAGPTVTVRVEGESSTLLPLTSVTLEQPDSASGCPSADSATAAINLAVKGDWDHGDVYPGGDFTETILGETLIDEAPTFKTWDVWINDKWGGGICEDTLSEGDEVLLVADYEPAPAYVPTVLPLVLTGAPSAVVIGEPFTVRVDKIHTRAGAYPEIGEGTPEPEEGVTVSGGGSSATTNSEGVATLRLTNAGSVALTATKTGDAPSAPVILCAQSVAGGNCATTAPSGSSSGTSSSAGGVLGYSSLSYKGPYAVVAKLAGLIDNHHYARGRAPRVLSGTVLAHTGIASVSLQLRRSYKNHCYAYDGVSARFAPARCGHGGFFKVGTQASFSYLLPESLPPGRYVLDVEATDAAGNRTTLARGTSRIVFYVR